MIQQSIGTCQNCHEKLVELVAKVKVGDKEKEVCELCFIGWEIENHRAEKIDEMVLKSVGFNLEQENV